jgi:hypothetical protein
MMYKLSNDDGETLHVRVESQDEETRLFALASLMGLACEAAE